MDKPRQKTNFDRSNYIAVRNAFIFAYDIKPSYADELMIKIHDLVKEDLGNQK